jgi:hypothetical protein
MTIDKDALKALVDHQIRTAWPGDRQTELRGFVHVPQVRKGGTTDLLIHIAAEIAVNTVLEQVEKEGQNPNIPNIWLNHVERKMLLEFVADPNGSFSLRDRLTVESVEGGGLHVKLRKFQAGDVR